MVSIAQPVLRGSFVHVFSAGDDFLAYDVNTNELLEITPAVVRLLGSSTMDRVLVEPNEHESKLARRELREAKRVGLFSSKRPTSLLEPYDYSQVRMALAHGVRKTTLIVTDLCNLSCRYCRRAGASNSSESMQGLMTLETARAAIDFLLRHSTEVEGKLAIGFYGGEPLLNRGVVEDSILYALRTARPRQLAFHMTTNGTLIDTKFIRFIVKHKVPLQLTVSVDGPQCVHDTNRISREGVGSFNIVYQNLRSIYSLDPEWFKSNVSFIVTVAPPFDRVARERFFEEWGLPCMGKLDTSMVDQDDWCPIPTSFEGAASDWAANIGKAHQDLAQSLIANEYRADVERGEHWLALDLAGWLWRFHKRSKTLLRKTAWRSVACLMGIDRLAVAPNGNLLPCEKVDWSSDLLALGDVWKGFDLERVFELKRRMFGYVRSHCRFCWALRLCSHCLISSCRPDFCQNQLESHCQAVLASLEYNLGMYHRVVSVNPHAIDQLE